VVAGHDPGDLVAIVTRQGYDRRPPARGQTVSVLIRFAPPSLTSEQYDKVVARLNADGVLPADGLEYEVCFGSEGNLKVSQVWDTNEHMEAFGQRLMPILQEFAIDPGAPEILDVHNTIQGSSAG
jgi:hypothetical protein